MRAVIYIRVSTKEQTKNLSLSTQKRACEQYCQQHGLVVDRVFTEEGESAKTTNRSEFKKLLEYCTKSRSSIDYVVVYAVNRFARDSTDHHVVRAILKKQGVTLRSVTEPIDDTSTGKLMEGVLSAFAQFDNDVKSERTVAGMKAALEKGRWTFQAPVGYTKPSPGASTASMIPDPVQGPLVTEAFCLFAYGELSKAAVRRRVTALGLRTRKGKKLSPQSFDWMLRRPIYAGRVVVERWNIDELGDFEPLVTEQTFARVQALLNGGESTVIPRTRDHPDFPLRRFARCALCGRPLTGAWSKGRRKRYAYYRCPKCGAVSVRKEALEARFLAVLRCLRPGKRLLALFRETLLDLWKEGEAEKVRRRLEIEHRLDTLRERKNRLVDSFVHERSVDKQTYEEQLGRIREEISEAEAEVAMTDEPVVDITGLLDFGVSVLSEPDQSWQDLPVGPRRVLQEVIFPGGLAFDGESFGTAVTSPVFKVLHSLTDEDVGLASPMCDS